jgi:hypothetical protein
MTLLTAKMEEVMAGVMEAGMNQSQNQIQIQNHLIKD